MFATVTINNKFTTQIKVNTGADTNILTTEDLQQHIAKLWWKPHQQPEYYHLKGIHKGKFVTTGFEVVDVLGHSSIILPTP